MQWFLGQEQKWDWVKEVGWEPINKLTGQIDRMGNVEQTFNSLVIATLAKHLGMLVFSDKVLFLI